MTFQPTDTLPFVLQEIQKSYGDLPDGAKAKLTVAGALPGTVIVKFVYKIDGKWHFGAAAKFEKGQAPSGGFLFERVW